MAKLTQKLIQKYVDEELSFRQAEKVKALLEVSVEDKLEEQNLRRIGSLLRVMDEENTAGVSFDGLADKVLTEIKAKRVPVPFFERVKVWLLEFFAHRRAVWLPASAAMGAACLAVVFIQTVTSVSDKSGASYDTGIVLHSVAASTKGSQIVSVDFGEETGFQYALDDGAGNTFGVVWIEEDK